MTDVPCRGGSMVPSVLPGARVRGDRPVHPLPVGAVVGYVDAAGGMVVHRVVDARRARGWEYRVCGDAMPLSEGEWIRDTAVAMVVRAVDNGAWGYRTQGWVGRMLARLYCGPHRRRVQRIVRLVADWRRRRRTAGSVTP